MAPPSPRRSSRARASNSQSQQSSVSSGASGRPERHTRSSNKPSSGKSTPSASSSEPLEDTDDTLLGRRRKRGHDDDLDKTSKVDMPDMANGSDEPQEEEDEAVRCICGAEDYPGRPPVEGPDVEFFAAIELTDDVTGFFVQCDICKVWQHGACVGIFSAESSPDEYFCEQCRKDLHKIHTAMNGQKYSKYVPLHRPSRSTSRATSITKEGTRSPKNGSGKNSRPNSTSQSSKRRSTMNSRDAAYDDEQLRRAIEASKEDAPLDNADIILRRTKRGRSNSEESVDLTFHGKDEELTSSRNLVSVKRQRTSSRSASPPIESTDAVVRDASEDELHTRNGVKKGRHSKPTRDRSGKEEKERQRQEAANKRKGRAEKRRGEDSDPSDDAPVMTITAKATTVNVEEPVAIAEPPVIAPPVPDTPPANLPPPAASSHKRGGRNNHKRGKGRNQYTRDRDGDNDNSPARSMSRDIQKNDDSASHAKTTHDTKHVSKAKSSLANKMSMSDMKRRVTAIMDFISRTQVDLAAEALPGQHGDTRSGHASPQKITATQVNGSSLMLVNGVMEAEQDETMSDSSRGKDFKELNCIEMMDVLTRDMVRWQSQYT